MLLNIDIFHCLNLSDKFCEMSNNNKWISGRVVRASSLGSKRPEFDLSVRPSVVKIANFLSSSNKFTIKQKQHGGEF